MVRNFVSTISFILIRCHPFQWILYRWSTSSTWTIIVVNQSHEFIVWTWNRIIIDWQSENTRTSTFDMNFSPRVELDICFCWCSMIHSTSTYHPQWRRAWNGIGFRVAILCSSVLSNVSDFGSFNLIIVWQQQQPEAIVVALHRDIMEMEGITRGRRRGEPTTCNWHMNWQFR